MLFLGVPVKPSFNAKAISALELLIEKPAARGGVSSSPWRITNNRDASNGACNSGGNTDANNGIYANNGDGANSGDGANTFYNNRSCRRRLWGLVSPGSAQRAPR